jgi:hypothetical protein
MTSHRRPSLASASAILVAVSLAVLSACGGDDDADPTVPPSVAPTAATATTAAAQTPAPAPTTTGLPPTVDTGDLPPVGTGDLPPLGTGDIPLPPVTADVPYAISVTVGVDDDPGRIEQVPLGATVSLSVTNPSADDEFHLHGFDLGDDQVMPAGQTATFTFVANQLGSFELESHETGDVLMVLEVI